VIYLESVNKYKRRSWSYPQIWRKLSTIV